MEKNKIYNMDCVEGLKLMGDKTVDLVITSPPYDNMRTYNNTLSWDFNKFKDVANELTRVLKDGGVIVWVVNDASHKFSESGTSFKQALYFKDECGLNLFDTMIWEKCCNGCLGSKFTYLQNFEYMFIFSKGKPKTFNPIEDRKNIRVGNTTANYNTKDGKADGQRKIMLKEYGRRTNIWKINPSQKKNHPAPFPYQLAYDHIISWSNEGDFILDPFIGSGTTAQACIDTNRNYIGFEIVKDYVENYQFTTNNLFI